MSKRNRRGQKRSERQGKGKIYRRSGKDQTGYPEERGGQDGRIRAKACRVGNTNGHHEYRVVVTQAEAVVVVVAAGQAGGGI